MHKGANLTSPLKIKPHPISHLVLEKKALIFNVLQYMNMTIVWPS